LLLLAGCLHFNVRLESPRAPNPRCTQLQKRANALAISSVAIGAVGSAAASVGASQTEPAVKWGLSGSGGLLSVGAGLLGWSAAVVTTQVQKECR
jgi:hypothetical protein